MLILASKHEPFVPSYHKKNPINAFFPAPPQPVIKKQSHKSIEWTEPDMRPQWCASGWLPNVQRWISPRILYTESVNWLSLANGRTEPYVGRTKERSTSLSIKQDHIDSQHKTVFFPVVCIIITSCLHIEQLLHYCSTYKNIVRNL